MHHFTVNPTGCGCSAKPRERSGGEKNSLQSLAKCFTGTRRFHEVTVGVPPTVWIIHDQKWKTFSLGLRPLMRKVPHRGLQWHVSVFASSLTWLFLLQRDLG